MSFAAAALVDFATRALNRAGMDEQANTVAQILVEADLMGHDTHGLALLPGYVGALRDGTMQGVGAPAVLRDHGAVAHWDGRWLSGVSLVAAAIDVAADKAERLGIGAVSIKQAHHTACLQAYLERATRRGLMVVIASSDPASASVAPFGGLDAVFGPDPIAVGIPTRGDPVLIDMSSSITTNGMVARSRAEGSRLKGHWVQDHAGNASDDPGVVGAEPPGSLLLAGGLDHGQKGYGLALTVEALSQGLSGYGRHNAQPRWSASVFVQVLDPKAFAGADDYADQTEHLVRLCHASRPRADLASVRLPGEKALALKRVALVEGLAPRPRLLEQLQALAKTLDLDFPQPHQL